MLFRKEKGILVGLVERIPVLLIGFSTGIIGRECKEIPMLIETRESRFHLSVLFTTLSTVIGAMKYVDMQLSSSSDTTSPDDLVKFGLQVLAALIVAPLVYKGLAKALLAAMRKWIWLKEKILGQFYVDGTWVGYYYAQEADLASDTVFYVVDFFKQDLSSLKVEGEAFTKSGSSRAKWESKAANISSDAARMIFVVDCTISGKGLRCDAVTDFYLRKTNDSKWPDYVDGHSTNVTTDKVESVSMTVRQKKICDGIYLNSVDALKYAHQLYAEDKTHRVA